MKIFLYLVEADLTSGASKCALELISHLKDTNYKPIVITQHKNNFNDFCNKTGIENYHIHYARICSLGMGYVGLFIAFFSRFFLNYFALKYLEKKIDFNKVSFIHSNGSSIDFGAYINKRKKFPHIWHVRDFFLFDKTWHPLVKNFPTYMEKNSTYIITTSNALRNTLIQHNVRPSKIKTIYDGIDFDNSSYESRDFQIVQKDVLNVVCVGHICQLKGQSVLIDAIAKMSESERKCFKFDFYGNFAPGEKTKIIKKITENNLDANVNFKGCSNNILPTLASYDIGIQPSHSEGFSRVTAEYMIAGLCVIAAEEGAIPELIQNGENGFLYKDYDSTELKEKLLYCYNNQKNMQKFAYNAKKKAIQSYNLNKNLTHIVELYNEIS